MKLISKLKPLYKRGGKSLMVVITVAILAITLITTVVIASILLVAFTSTNIQNVRTNTTQILSQGRSNLNIYLDNLISAYDSIVSELNNNEQIAKTTVTEVIEKVKSSRSDIANITIFDTTGEIYTYASSYKPKEDYNIFKQSWYYRSNSTENSSYRFTYPHVQNIYESRYSWVVSIIYSAKVNKEPKLIIIDINFDVMEEYCKEINIGNRGYVYLVNQNNEIIYHPQQQLLYADLKTESTDFLVGKQDGNYINNENDSVVGIATLQQGGWKLIGVCYLSDVRDMQSRMLYIVIGVLLVAVAFTIAIAIAISRRISKPIAILAQAMEEVEAGDMDVYVAEDSYTEVESLSTSFNSMIDRIKGLMERIKKEEKELRKTELKALQAQINPHFLYNTLDSILWMCEQNNSKGAVTMVSALAKLFRISLSKGKEVITIKEELLHVESYLTIQKIRYKDQFDYKIEADDNILGCQCLKIIIQPLVENAIYHGIDRMVDKGLITIQVMDQGDNLSIFVRDNGLGIPADELETILSGSKHKHTGSGIGIRNVHQRIRIYFGNQYGLHVKSELDVGTEVEIVLPKIEGGRME